MVAVLYDCMPLAKAQAINRLQFNNLIFESHRRHRPWMLPLTADALTNDVIKIKNL